MSPYPGADDPDDLLNYLLSIQNTSNQPAVQTRTQSQLQVQAQRQAAKVSQNSSGFWSSSIKRAESVWNSAVSDAESAWNGVTRRAEAFVDAHSRVASVVRTMDEVQSTIGLAMAVSSSVMDPKPVVDLPQRYPTVSKAMMVGVAAAAAVFPEIGAREVIADEAMSLLEERLMVRLSSNRSALFNGARSAEGARLISSISRVSSNVANKPFMTAKALAEGWSPPYPKDIDIRQIVSSRETHFVRFFDGNEPQGQFLVRYKEIAHIPITTEVAENYRAIRV